MPILNCILQPSQTLVLSKRIDRGGYDVIGWDLINKEYAVRARAWKINVLNLSRTCLQTLVTVAVVTSKQQGLKSMDEL